MYVVSPAISYSCLDGYVQKNDGKNWIVGRTLEEATERATVLAAGQPFTLEQDEDVLDTWFSSGLWPFSIMGWPEKACSFLSSGYIYLTGPVDA